MYSVTPLYPISAFITCHTLLTSFIVGHLWVKESASKASTSVLCGTPINIILLLEFPPPRASQPTRCCSWDDKKYNLGCLVAIPPPLIGNCNVYKLILDWPFFQINSLKRDSIFLNHFWPIQIVELWSVYNIWGSHIILIKLQCPATDRGKRHQLSPFLVLISIAMRLSYY